MTVESAKLNHAAESVNGTERVIRDAACEILAADGMQALSMRAVAARSGISPTAIYRYYESKEVLVDKLVTYVYRRFDEYMQAAIANLPEGSLEKLIALGEAYIRFAFENRPYFQVIFNIQSSNRKGIRELPGHGGYDVLERTVREGIAAGKLQDIEPRLIAIYLWSLVHGLVTLTMACELRDEAAGQPGSGNNGAVVLFHQFKPIIQSGLKRFEL